MLTEGALLLSGAHRITYQTDKRIICDQPYSERFYPRKNLFFRANQDLGRIMKTVFILDYLSQPSLRQRIRRGLLKVEELHQLARDIFYAKRGRISASEIHKPVSSCSCLTLISACVIYWQDREVTRLLRRQAS